MDKKVYGIIWHADFTKKDDPEHMPVSNHLLIGTVKHLTQHWLPNLEMCGIELSQEPNSIEELVETLNTKVVPALAKSHKYDPEKMFFYVAPDDVVQKMYNSIYEDQYVIRINPLTRKDKEDSEKKVKYYEGTFSQLMERFKDELAKIREWHLAKTDEKDGFFKHYGYDKDKDKKLSLTSVLPLYCHSRVKSQINDIDDLVHALNLYYWNFKDVIRPCLLYRNQQFDKTYYTPVTYFRKENFEVFDFRSSNGLDWEVNHGCCYDLAFMCSFK